MGKKWVCEIGCGEKKVLDNSICLDIRKTDKVDIIADARMLPIKTEKVDHVYSSHVIEHFSHREVNAVIDEWVRVLMPGGTMEIRCPDFRARSLLFFLNPTWKNVINVYGEQDYPGNYHQCCFTYKLLKGVLNNHHIIKVSRIRDGFKGIPFIPGDLHVIGWKREG